MRFRHLALLFILEFVTSSKALANEECTATFTVYQKDAYLTSNGREHPYLPVHTSTSLIIECPGLGTRKALEHPNHGTRPEERSPNGKPYLDITRIDSVQLSHLEAENLKTAYTESTCDHATTSTFLSIDQLNEEVNETIHSEEFQKHVAEEILQAVSRHIQDDVRQAIHRLIESGDFNKALAYYYEHLNDPSRWASLFTKVWYRVVEKQLDLKAPSFHVCNNDAALQIRTWESFKNPDTEPLTAQAHQNLCHGPLLFL